MPLDETVAADTYRDHAAVLRRFVGRAAIDPTRAEDVVRELILRVWRRAPPEVTKHPRQPCRLRAAAAEPDEHEDDEEPLGGIGESVRVEPRLPGSRR